MDRLPESAPFPVGARLVYRGTSRTFADAECRVPLLAPGMGGVVTETRPGRRGTMRDLTNEFDDEPVYDTTTDGWSVVRTDAGKEYVALPEHGWSVAEHQEGSCEPTLCSCGLPDDHEGGCKGGLTL